MEEPIRYSDFMEVKKLRKPYRAEKGVKPKEKLDLDKLAELRSLVGRIMSQKSSSGIISNAIDTKYIQIAPLDNEEIIRRINEFKEEEVKANIFLYLALFEAAEERKLNIPEKEMQDNE